MSRWMDFFPKVCNDDRFDNMLGIPGKLSIVTVFTSFILQVLKQNKVKLKLLSLLSCLRI